MGRRGARRGEARAHPRARSASSAEQTISADLGDAKSLADMASRAKVVLNMVGPYTKYGRPVIKACVENGAHYADLTGEIPFVRQMIDEFDEPPPRPG